MDKKLSIQLNGSRKIIGILRGYDIFLNITLTDALEVDSKGEKMNIGATVCRTYEFFIELKIVLT